MTLKSQFKTLKENWLLAVIFIIIVGALFFTQQGSPLTGFSKPLAYQEASYDAIAGIRASSSYMPSPIYQQDFAPEIKERIITKTSSLTSEVPTGKFKEADTQIKSVIQSTESYLLNENINSYDYGKRTYYSGSYQIKVATNKYPAVLEQLKKIGEIKNFNENANDETQQYTDLKSLIETEKSRLSRYNQMYNEATLIADKIQLSDKIFEQERIIKMYEESLSSLNNRVTYSTIYLTINEKQSDYANIVWVKFSDLTRALVESINSLLSLLFIILPWAIAIAIVWGIVRATRKRK